MKNVEFIFFDLGNVLVNFSHERACRQMAEVAETEIETIREVVFDGGLQSKYERGQLSTNEFLEVFSEETGSSPDQNLFLEAASDIFELNLRMMPLVCRLARAGIPIGILSNTCETHWEFLCKRFPGLIEMFPIKVLSFEVGSAKPDFEIYERAKEIAGVPMERIFFTDDRRDNVAGAGMAGMNAYMFESVAKTRKVLRKSGVRW